jgi:hypothetical protein
MTLVTLRTFIETDLANAPLQVIMDAADEDLTLAVGPDATDVQKDDMVGEEFLYLTRRAATISAITEFSGGVLTTLVANDYELQPSGTSLRRLSTVTHPATGWEGTVTITYVPGDLNRRDRALVQLVQLDLDYRHGAKSESIGDYSRSQEDYNTARAKIIAGARTAAFA